MLLLGHLWENKTLFSLTLFNLKISWEFHLSSCLFLSLAEKKLENPKKLGSLGSPKANMLFCPVPVVSWLYLFIFLGFPGCLIFIVSPLDIRNFRNHLVKRFYFLDRKTEAQRGEITCLKTLSKVSAFTDSFLKSLPEERMCLSILEREEEREKHQLFVHPLTPRKGIKPTT